MADNTKKTGGRDRATVSKSEGYEVSYFATKHGITSEQARNLIAKVGNSREKLNKAADKLNAQIKERAKKARAKKKAQKAALKAA